MIELKDRAHHDLRVELHYSIDSQNDLVIRHATIVAQQEGKSAAEIACVLVSLFSPSRH